MTGDLVAGAHLAQRRDLALAPCLGVGAARMESAARRRVDRARDIALQQMLFALDPRIGDRDCSQQGLGVRMQRPREQGLLVSIFDDLTEVHDRNAVTDVLDHGKIVGNEQI